MKGAVLGSKYFVSAGNGDQTRHGPGSLAVRNVVSPCSSVGRPRCSRYQALSCAGSFALKKMPPTPRTRSMAGEPTRPRTPREQFLPRLRSYRQEDRMKLYDFP